jgi:hypothetical protein
MPYSEQLIQQVWEKTRVNPDIAMDKWREDECGAWIERERYGDRLSQFGWVIINVSAGGSDTLKNLRAFNHRNGYEVAVQQPKCQVTADRTDLPPFGHISEPRNRDV